MTVSMTTRTAAGPALPPAGLLGSWVEAHAEPCRGGRIYRLLVNHRTAQALELTDADAALCAHLANGAQPAGPAVAALLHDLREQGFLACDPPPAAPHRPLRLSLSRLDLRWNGAGRLVRAVHDRGARHLFRPVAVAAQAVLALAGLAAVAAALFSHEHFQLRVHPAQVPLVLGLGAAAIAVHEFAHALVVVHHNRTVDGAGMRLHLGTPAFYVESADALLLSRRQRLIQAAAGVWAEWQFTSIIAIWLWCSPLPFAVPLLHRFVLLNAATIATNLLPFTGLDGSWLLADAIGTPDLSRRCRGSLSRLLAGLASRQPTAAEDRALAGYCILNGAVAVALLAAAGFFWYQLFGDLADTLAHQGPAGWLTLAAAAGILAMPTLTATAPRLAAAAGTARELCAAMAFRVQWRWRIPATRQLATAIPQLTGLSHQQLGVLAGHLHRTRAGRHLHARAPSYGVVLAGAVAATTATGEPVTLTAGATWLPHHRLDRAIRRAVLIHVSAATVHELLPTTAASAWPVHPARA
jgi:hypothetical protein